MIKKILLSLILLSFSFANSNVKFSLYGGGLFYNKSKKIGGDTEGIYVMGFDSPLKAEMGISHTTIKQKENNGTITQSDFTLLLHFFKGYNFAYKIGAHKIKTTDDLTKDGIVYTVGGTYYKLGKYYFKANAYYSVYSNLETSPRILQISPELGYTYGNFVSKKNPAFHLGLKIDYIHPTQHGEDNDLRNSYVSTTLRFVNHFSNFTTILNKWYGKRVFAVQKDGFVVHNTKDEETGGFTIEESYSYNENTNFNLSYQYTTFKESDNDTESNMNVIVFSYLYGF